MDLTEFQGKAIEMIEGKFKEVKEKLGEDSYSFEVVCGEEEARYYIGDYIISISYVGRSAHVSLNWIASLDDQEDLYNNLVRMHPVLRAEKHALEGDYGSCIDDCRLRSFEDETSPEPKFRLVADEFIGLCDKRYKDSGEKNLGARAAYGVTKYLEDDMEAAEEVFAELAEKDIEEGLKKTCEHFFNPWVVSYVDPITNSVREHLIVHEFAIGLAVNCALGVSFEGMERANVEYTWIRWRNDGWTAIGSRLNRKGEIIDIDKEWTLLEEGDIITTLGRWDKIPLIDFTFRKVDLEYVKKEELKGIIRDKGEVKIVFPKREGKITYTDPGSREGKEVPIGEGILLKDRRIASVSLHSESDDQIEATALKERFRDISSRDDGFGGDLAYIDSRLNQFYVKNILRKEDGYVYINKGGNEEEGKARVVNEDQIERLDERDKIGFVYAHEERSFEFRFLFVGGVGSGPRVEERGPVIEETGSKLIDAARRAVEKIDGLGGAGAVPEDAAEVDRVMARKAQLEKDEDEEAEAYVKDTGEFEEFFRDIITGVLGITGEAKGVLSKLFTDHKLELVEILSEARGLNLGLFAPTLRDKLLKFIGSPNGPGIIDGKITGEWIIKAQLSFNLDGIEFKIKDEETYQTNREVINGFLGKIYAFVQSILKENDIDFDEKSITYAGDTFGQYNHQMRSPNHIQKESLGYLSGTSVPVDLILTYDTKIGLDNPKLFFMAFVVTSKM